jgi:hypothetical protein
MLPTLRKFLIIFLTILQLFAPLVHAHASEFHSNQGLHVPGLEHYSSHHQSSIYIKAHSSLHACIDGVLVGVGLGLKQNSSTAPYDADNSYYVPTQRPRLSSVALPFKIYNSGQKQPLLARLLTSHPPSRAPPLV